MRNKVRPDPRIPDHEVLRKIGGGAYGEVWLARSITGALRAVKVVWREDFEDERTFEREFEGILKFEPISRDHPGLVNILHVGRSADGRSFYYYVMELGDDLVTGREINPVEYEARTLREEGKTTHVPMPVEEVIDVGLGLAEALEHLHERGLAHRDVKPSNVIFVNGRAKLADIGLVAARGQRTFVGTEGFVPPEGPGSAQADVYSLGKVLYEIATGKDRLQFPELPEKLPDKTDRSRWLALNSVICDVCNPQLSKRRIQSAGELAEALRRLRRGKSPHRRPVALILAGVALVSAGAVLGWVVLRDNVWDEKWAAPLKEKLLAPQPQVGQVRVVSYPEGADVYDAQGTRIGSTPTEVRIPVGERAVFSVRRSGFRPVEIDQVVPPAAAAEPLVLGRELEIFRPPEPGQPWTDHLGMRFLPVDGHHVSAGYVPEEVWRRFRRNTTRELEEEVIEITERGEKRRVVAVKPEAATFFSTWATETGRDGYLTENDYYQPSMADSSYQGEGLSKEAWAAGLRPFRVRVAPIPYSVIVLNSEPPGADVLLDGEPAGNTAGGLRLERIKPGRREIQFLLEGYKPKKTVLDVGPDQAISHTGVLERNESIVFGQTWKNGLGMEFVPLGPDLMVSVYETRVRDFAPFLEESEQLAPLQPDFSQTPDHPVVLVSRDDAEAFCDWLTARERAQERIGRRHYYRLPTDLEWSSMALLGEEQGGTPGERDIGKEEIYPWGVEWPPDPSAPPVANLADRAAAQTHGTPLARTIPNYLDGFANTAPVGSFPPNAHGIYDLCGNVHEWVQDDYSRDGRFGVVRGGGWNTYQPEHLYLGWRNAVPPGFRDSIYGFRVVLAKDAPVAREGDAR